MLALLMAAAMAQSCTAAQQAAGTVACVPPSTQWRTFVTEEDRHRLRDWRDAWTEALDSARAAGHGAEIDAEGPLLKPDIALTDPLPPEGEFNCRTIKLGSPPTGGLPFVSYPPFRCRISRDGDRLRFTKLTGSQRPTGRLYADETRRLVFLGTLQLGDERRVHQYGIDRERDMIGILERVDEQRWRLVFPYPHFESLLDVIELTPADAP